MKLHLNGTTFHVPTSIGRALLAGELPKTAPNFTVDEALAWWYKRHPSGEGKTFGEPGQVRFTAMITSAWYNDFLTLAKLCGKEVGPYGGVVNRFWFYMPLIEK